MATLKLTLSILPETFGICHLDKNSQVPPWALEKTSFRSVTRTQDELSIVCPQDKIPSGVLFEDDWRAFKVQGPLPITSIGVVASLSKPLADKGIPIFYISTYETDYILVEGKNLEKAEKILDEFCEITK